RPAPRRRSGPGPRSPAMRCRGSVPSPLLEILGHHLGVQLVPREQLEAALEQGLQLRVPGVGDQDLGEGPVDRLVVSDWLVGLSSGVTPSFLTRARAWSFTAWWSRTICSAKSLTSGFLVLASACLPASMSSTPAV